jgi:signal transduction histidine kinase/ligand-binding sensor domain-containing protein
VHCSKGALDPMRSTFLQGRGNTARAIWCGIGLCTAFGASPAVAINPDLSLTQLAHSAWRLQDGDLPGTPTAIAQTKDGYMWIGTQAGLVRFDGANFVPFVPPPSEGPKLSNVTALYGATDGSLWIGGKQLMQWKDGQLHRYTPFGFFATIREAPDGSIWAARYHTMDDLGPLCEARKDSLICYGRKQGIPFKDAGPLAIENSGAIWIATANRLARWQDAHSEVFAPSELARSEELEGYKSVAIAPDGSVWSGVIHGGPGLGLEHFLKGAWSPVVSGKLNSSNWEVTALLFDRDNTLWVGTANQGIYRIDRSRIDHFGISDGLSGDSVVGFCEDHEGDVWVVTSKGVDKFRPMQVNTFSSRHGLSDDGVQAVVASRSGSIWVSNATAVDRIENSTVITYRQQNGLPGRSPTALLEDRQGRIWIGVDDGVAVFDHERFARVHSGSQPIGPVLQFAEGRDATIWAISATIPSRLVRINETEALDSISPPAGTRIGTVAAAPDGALWMGLINGVQSCDFARYAHGQWETFPLHRPPNSAMCTEIVTPDADTVFASASDGIIEWHKGLVRTLTGASGLPCARVYSLAFDKAGDLWIYLECGVVVIHAGQLAEWWNEPTRKLQIRLLDISDGAQSGFADFHPRAAVAADGKLWFANGTDLQFVDPKHWLHNSVPPPVQIQTLIADDRTYVQHSPTKLPPLTRNVQINFTALSFVAPQRVRFRYRLYGWDTDWQDPGGRRQSFYTNLHPGKYRFSVIAANDDGLWNMKGDSLEFELEPAYYQTWWFRLLCVAAALVLLQSVFVYRLRRAKVNIQQRLAARLSERERIARDLHDTLLQSVQGLMLKFHAVANAIPPDSAARNKLENALAQGREVIAEGRSRVVDLRRADAPSTELATQLSSYGASFLQTSEATFNASVVGQPLPLNPIAADEVLNIGREAMGNAFMHAEARHIEIELAYGEKSLALRIRDDGKGMERGTVETGQEGHWGIVGMRERSRALGANFNVWSRPGSGTEIELIVPAATAYAACGGVTKRPLVERLRTILGIGKSGTLNGTEH